MTSNDRVTAEGHGLVLERIFDAPQHLVWSAWTEAEHFRRWYGPANMSVDTCEIDFRVGGRHLFGLRATDGSVYWTAGEYREIDPPLRFVTTDAMADEHGEIVEDTTTVVDVRFEDLGDGRTKVTLSQSGWPDPTMAEHASGGWSQAFDKLAAVLA